MSSRVVVVPPLLLGLGLGVPLSLGGCAVVRPPVQAVSTGWADPKPDARAAAEAAQASAAAQRSGNVPRVTDSAPATPGAPTAASTASERTGAIVTHTPRSTASPTGAFVGRDGVRVPVPAGYTDRIGAQTAGPTGGAAQVALLHNQGGHSISVETIPTTAASLNGYVDAYVAEVAARSEVTARSIKTVAGQAGVRLMLRQRASGEVSVTYVTLKDPGVILRIDASAENAAQSDAAEWVATNTQL